MVAHFRPVKKNSSKNKLNTREEKLYFAFRMYVCIFLAFAKIVKHLSIFTKTDTAVTGMTSMATTISARRSF